MKTLTIRPMTFASAIDRHAALARAVNQCDAGTVDRVRHAWNEVTGAAIATDTIATSVRYSVPVELLHTMRGASGIPATVFCVTLLKALQAGASDTDAVNRAVGALEERRANVSALMEGWGYDLSLAWGAMLQIDQLPVAMKDEVLAVARLAGRMAHAMAKSGDVTRRQNPSEVSGLTQSGDVGRILSHEFAAMATPGLAVDAITRLESHASDSIKLDGEEPGAPGPFVLVLDESGSMHGHRAVWCKAVASALAAVAHKEGRAVSVVHFSTATRITRLAPGDTAAMLRMVASHLSGGTDIGHALSVALSEVRAADATTAGQQTDLVLVTDGQGDVWNEQINRVINNGTNLWSIAIEVDFSSLPLATKARRYVHVSDADIRAGAADTVAAKVAASAYDARRAASA